MPTTADTRRAAIAALGRVGDRRATAALLGWPRRATPSCWWRPRARWRGIGDRRAFEPLLRCSAHRDAAVRQAAIGALNSIGHPDMAAADRRACSTMPIARTRESAVRIAGYFGYRELRRRLLVAACRRSRTSRSARRRSSTCRTSTMPRVVPGARDGAAGARRREARAAAAGRWHGWTTPAARGGAAAARSTIRTRWVRYFAVRGLGERRDAGAVRARWRGSPTRTARTHVRIAALEAVGAIGGRRGRNPDALARPTPNARSRRRRCGRSAGCRGRTALRPLLDALRGERWRRRRRRPSPRWRAHGSADAVERARVDGVGRSARWRWRARPIDGLARDGTGRRQRRAAAVDGAGRAAGGRAAIRDGASDGDRRACRPATIPSLAARPRARAIPTSAGRSSRRSAGCALRRRPRSSQRRSIDRRRRRSARPRSWRSPGSARAAWRAGCCRAGAQRSVRGGAPGRRRGAWPDSSIAVDRRGPLE